MLTLSTDPAFNAVHHLSVALHRFLAKKICKRKVDQDQCMEKKSIKIFLHFTQPSHLNPLSL